MTGRLLSIGRTGLAATSMEQVSRPPARPQQGPSRAPTPSSATLAAATRGPRRMRYAACRTIEFLFHRRQQRGVVSVPSRQRANRTERCSEGTRLGADEAQQRSGVVARSWHGDASPLRADSAAAGRGAVGRAGPAAIARGADGPRRASGASAASPAQRGRPEPDPRPPLYLSAGRGGAASNGAGRCDVWSPQPPASSEAPAGSSRAPPVWEARPPRRQRGNVAAVPPTRAVHCSAQLGPTGLGPARPPPPARPA